MLTIFWICAGVFFLYAIRAQLISGFWPHDLIWVGNTLLPRWLVFAVMALVAMTMASVFTWLTR